MRTQPPPWPADVAGGERDVHQRARWCGSCRCPRSGPSRRRTSCAAACRPPSARRSSRAALTMSSARQAGDLAPPPRASSCWPRAPCRSRLVEAAMNSLSTQPLLGDVGQQRVEQREVGAGVDREVQDVVLAGLGLAGVDGHGAARVDDDDPRRLRAARPAARAFFLSSEVPRRFGTQWFRK